ncbi:DUF2796 domain-containing protein [Pseudomonas syringae]|uniref:Zinc-binding protein n=1 Tax=Pseudomonas syringae TaxID=317 RepID=A0AB38BV62_PSESX|nr:DUF2796 domain-containing protein [Pseudomonas syringae]KEZ72612.1 hypothetical protein C5I_0118475 [Pseudomonas syringae pv. syringae FF5]KFF82081.1 hypothetical protein HM80_20145 [Pseudomonas syringae pv. syringae]MBI6720791.1 DUF2796 domain-containing protein [Pseudomonas syringae]MBI6753875.1 DUF2796 domain-containing protein [Pseudomonas syringae]MBI6780927.1 DUF2796 domain-containing protein [Pseudomonas syringae]
MRRLLLALPFALLPLVAAHAAEEHDHDHGDEHGSLGAHEHGVGRLDVVLEGKTLEFEFDSPAMNIVGFEHVATSDEDKAKVAKARELLLKPNALFSIADAANCSATSVKLESPLFGDKDDDHDEHADAGEADHHEHSEIHGHYKFVCDAPAILKKLDLSQIFITFPDTKKLQVQLISPGGQSGAEVIAANPTLKF